MPVPGAGIYNYAESRKPLSTVGPAPCASIVTAQHTSRSEIIRKLQIKMKDGTAKRRMAGNTCQQSGTGFLPGQTKLLRLPGQDFAWTGILMFTRHRTYPTRLRGPLGVIVPASR